MKTLARVSMLAIVALVCIGVIWASDQKKAKKEKVLWAAEDIKWEQLPDAPPGVMSSMVWGDHNGAHGGFTKFPAGFKTPLHHHTYETKIIVIKGAYVHNGKAYGPGSYLWIPGGDKHETAGAKDSESIFYLEQSGKFDLILVDAPAKKN
jgi:quercetin dioxygenase-like cupin family protein